MTKEISKAKQNNSRELTIFPVSFETLWKSLFQLKCQHISMNNSQFSRCCIRKHLVYRNVNRMSSYTLENTNTKTFKPVHH